VSAFTPIGYGGAAPANVYAPPAALSYSPPTATSLSGGFDWSIDDASRRRNAQLFNQLDRARVGKLSGVQARNVLAESGVPMTVLAQIWTLADYDRDGQLTVDEFCIAMHLVDVAKTGRALPATLPLELMSASGRVRTAAMPADEDLRLAASAFDDRRRENFDRGAAELDKRRQALLEEERLLREERERRDREEFERRERERANAERLRQLEEERERQRMMELAAIEAERQRRIREQQEAEARERQRARQLEWERKRVQELIAQKQTVADQCDQVKQQQKNISFQLQAFGEKADEVNDQISGLRAEIVGITGEIEGLKLVRDEKVAASEAVKSRIAAAQQRLNEVAQRKHEALTMKRTALATNTTAAQMEQATKAIAARRASIEKGTREVREARAECERKREMSTDVLAQLAELKATLADELKTNAAIYARVVEAQQRVVDTVGTYQPPDEPATFGGFGGADAFTNGGHHGVDPFGAGGDDGWASTNGGSFDHQAPVSAGRGKADTTGATVRYRALYEFQSRNDDELSFQPGDVIIVFKVDFFKLKNEMFILPFRITQMNLVGWPDRFAIRSAGFPKRTPNRLMRRLDNKDNSRSQALLVL
jgi:hypothetical protein